MDDPAKLMRVLKSYPAREKNGYEVSKFVNSPKNEKPKCIVPAIAVA